MATKSIDKILKDDLKLDTSLLKSSEKIKKLHITNDGDIIDNSELATDFVKDMLIIRDKAVSKWYGTNRTSCSFVMKIYNPNLEDGTFIDIVSRCITTRNVEGNLLVFYKNYIKIYNSNDDSKNNKPYGINTIEPLLFYLKINGLIKNIKYVVQP